MRACLLATTILMGALTPGSVAAQAQGENTPQPESHQNQAAAARGAQRVVIQSSHLATSYTNAQFVQVTGRGFELPAGQTFVLVATFTAESACAGGSWCSVRIICNGVELFPASGTDFAFNSPGGSTWKSLSVTRHTDRVAGGAYFCEVETAQVGGSTHRLDDWTFVVEAWRAS